MTSWVPGAAGSDYDIDNLPLGVFGATPELARPGVAIGNAVADLDLLAAQGLIDEPALRAARTLNVFLGCGRARWSALRARLQHLFGERAAPEERAAVEPALVPRAQAHMRLPIAAGDYVDFNSSIEHATAAGRLFRPDAPLPVNYRSMPIGYHGRSSGLVADGSRIARPNGQYRAAGEAAPVFGPTAQLDFELELGAIAGPGNAAGVPISIGSARDHLYGFVLLNDWSARDVQAWESVPLGPFLGKSFATSISPWVVSLDALEPFRVDNRTQEPQPLPHLRTRERWAYDIELEVFLETPHMRARAEGPALIARVNFRDMYWNAAQQLAHLTSNGSRLRPGDLLGSGTVSGSGPGAAGCLLEKTRGGRDPFTLPNGERRTYLEDGDTVIMRGRAAGAERRVGLGELRGTVAG